MFNEPTHNNPNRKVTLNVEDASCTEAWIEVKFTGVEFPTELRFYINDSLAESITAVKDTLLYIEGLQPSRTYRVKAEAVRPQETVVKSMEAEVTTLDTTSHNFTWQTYTFGGSGGSSYLRDVAIINENDIWAVGEINIADTTNPNGYTTYNAVHWNGQEWELKRIMFYIDQDQPWAGKTSSPCQSCFLFGDGKLAVSSNVQTAIFNSTDDYQIIKMGFAWEERFTINSFWGTSSNDFYVIGDNGNIAHYNGTSWEKVESGTDLDIYDIWGDYNTKTNKYEILAVASKILQSTDRDILSITNSRVEKLDETGINWSLHGIWFSIGKKYYAVGSGIYRKKNITDPKWNNNWEEITQYYINAVRGEDVNDIFMCGAFGEVLHYNGKSWHSYLNQGLPYFSGSMVKLSYKGNTVCIVGYNGRSGIIYLGKRN
jgi:hypothetical protein